jgi:phosphatidylserine/phosphatidylglycerophosphate/cardiolipin synthase-like enzyme
LKNGVIIYEYMLNYNNIKKKKFPFFTSLHSKTMVFDDKISWIGSFNLDPRSAIFNTECVAIFESKEFAAELSGLIEKDIKTSWKLSIENGQTVWSGKLAGTNKIRIFKHSPYAPFFKRIIFKLMRFIPESLI